MNTERPWEPCTKHPESDIYSATDRCVDCTAEDVASAPWPIMTRTEAINRGYKKFWTGKPCVNGHVKQRYSTSGICTGCNSMNSIKHNQKIRKRLSDINEGLESVNLMLHPDDAKAVQDYAAVLRSQRGSV